MYFKTNYQCPYLNVIPPNGTTGLFVNMTTCTTSNISANNVTITCNGFTNIITGTTITSTCAVPTSDKNTKDHALNRTNSFLNVVPLLPEATYVVGGYVTYLTDNTGRVIQIDAILRDIARFRDEFQQRQAKFFKDGSFRPNDDGGHMIGSRFNGHVEQINYFPQELATNRYGPWKNMEDEWQRILEGRPNANPPVAAQTVRVQIKPFEPPASTTRRPNEFNVRYWYGTNLPISVTISNN